MIRPGRRGGGALPPPRGCEGGTPRNARATPRRPLAARSKGMGEREAPVARKGLTLIRPTRRLLLCVRERRERSPPRSSPGGTGELPSAPSYAPPRRDIGVAEGAGLHWYSSATARPGRKNLQKTACNGKSVPVDFSGTPCPGITGTPSSPRVSWVSEGYPQGVPDVPEFLKGEVGRVREIGPNCRTSVARFRGCSATISLTL